MFNGSVPSKGLKDFYQHHRILTSFASHRHSWVSNLDLPHASEYGRCVSIDEWVDKSTQCFVRKHGCTYNITDKSSALSDWLDVITPLRYKVSVPEMPIFLATTLHSRFWSCRHPLNTQRCRLCSWAPGSLCELQRDPRSLTPSVSVDLTAWIYKFIFRPQSFCWSDSAFEAPGIYRKAKGRNCTWSASLEMGLLDPQLWKYWV